MSERESVLERACREIMEIWNRDDGSRMRERGDEMHDVAEEALAYKPPPSKQPEVSQAVVPHIDGARWEVTADDMELALVLNGTRLGGICVWTDNQTGELAWWTASVVSVQGKNIELSDAYATEEQARSAVTRAIQQAKVAS